MTSKIAGDSKSQPMRMEQNERTQEALKEEQKLLGVMKDIFAAKAEITSPDKNSPSKKLAEKMAKQLGVRGIEKASSQKSLRFSEESSASKVDATAKKTLETPQTVKKQPQDLTTCLNVKSATMHLNPRNVKSYEEHVRAVMQSIKIDYFNYLNIMIRDRGLGPNIEFGKFSAFYTNLIALIEILNADNLDDYVLRYVDEAKAVSSEVKKINALTSKIVEDLISYGFKGPDQTLLFWSGGFAKEKAMENSTGLTDEQILLLQVLWGLDSLVTKKEREKPSFTKTGEEHSIHTRLIVAFSSILADYSKGKEVYYYLGYPEGTMNVSSAFWKGELPVLKKIAAKVHLIYFEENQWKGPFDLNDRKNDKILDKLCIERKDYGGEKGPKTSSSVRLSIGDAKLFIQKWKWYAAIEKYLKELPETTC